jgi:hypothetical protein
MMMEKAAWLPQEDETMAPVTFPHPLGCFEEKKEEEAQHINGRCIR